MLRQLKALTTRFWLLAILSLMIAGLLSYFVVTLWEQWSAVIILAYAVYVLGAVSWMPSRTPVGNAISAGVAFGLFIPIVIWLLQAR